RMYLAGDVVFFFKQKTAYEITRCLEFRRVLFRSAKAADLPATTVRRAAMLCGSVAPVAEAALRDGVAGLSSFALEVGRPVQPMQIGRASCRERVAIADVGGSLERTGRCGGREHGS